jgi:hypothetical protein
VRRQGRRSSATDPRRRSSSAGGLQALTQHLQALTGNEGIYSRHSPATREQHIVAVLLTAKPFLGCWLHFDAEKVDALKCILALRASTLDIRSTVI